MSQDIMKEVIFLLHSFLMGVIITFVYDWFLIIRRLIKHNMFFVSFEDLLFWIVCAISVFAMLYRENSGTLRWFAVAGAFLGMLIYKKTISPLIVKSVSKVLQKLFQMLSRIFGVLLGPLRLAVDKGKKGCGRIRGEGSKLSKYVKNRLTACRKVLKIILCKR